MNSDEQHALEPEPALEVWLATGIKSAFQESTLDPAERARYRQLRSPLKRKQFEVSRALLQSLGPTTNAISLSHSGEYAGMACSRAARSIGVDLEVHKPRDVISLAQFAFASEESRALIGRGNALELFYELWVLKEACAKALGLQLVDALRHCVFAIDGRIVSGVLPTNLPWHAYVWRPRRELSLATVVIGSRQAAVVRTREWPADALTRWPQTVTVAGDGATAP